MTPSDTKASPTFSVESLFGDCTTLRGSRANLGIRSEVPLGPEKRGPRRNHVYKGNLRNILLLRLVTYLPYVTYLVKKPKRLAPL